MYLIFKRYANTLVRQRKKSDKLKECFSLHKEYLSAKEASDYTGISIPKLARLRLEGKGCAYVRIGDSKTKAIIRYRRIDLDRWLEDNLIKTTGGL